MRIERVTEVDEALVTAFARLIPQLSANRRAPTRDDLAATARESVLFVARDGDDVLGTLTLVLYRLPTGLRGWIHDVVVDEAARGRGAGEALTRAALDQAGAAGVESVHLTSRPAREAANRLYRRIGFDRSETNVYVWRPG